MITVTIMKKTKKLKTWVGIFKNMGGNIPGGNFLGENFQGWNFPCGSLMGGNFPGGSFPDICEIIAIKIAGESDVIFSQIWYDYDVIELLRKVPGKTPVKALQLIACLHPKHVYTFHCFRRRAICISFFFEHFFHFS